VTCENHPFYRITIHDIMDAERLNTLSSSLADLSERVVELRRYL